MIQSAKASESTAVPFIDISAALAGHGRRETAARLGKAAREIGFIQIVGHGIDPALFHRVHDESGALWRLPDDQLDKLLSPTGHPFRGVRYALDPTGARIWQRLQNNRIESPAAALAEGYEGDVLDYFGGNVHPQLPALNAAIADCFVQARSLGAELMRLFALELDLEEHSFDALFDKDVSYFAVQDYPPMPHAAPDGERLFEHSDSGALTMLHQRGDYPGLRFRMTNGERITVPVVDEAIVINVGDLMARWTNDGWLATPHGVIDGEPGLGRASIAVHYLPNVDAVIAPFPQCVKPGMEAYEPVRMYDWDKGFFAKKSRVLRLADER